MHFYQITECSTVTHLHYPELKARTYIQPKPKKKFSPYPIQPEKIIFLSKKIKIQLFDVKCAILNKYVYESRNIEMLKSEVTKT